MQIPHRRVPITVHHPKSVLLKIVMLKDWTFFHSCSQQIKTLPPAWRTIDQDTKTHSFKVKYKERSGWLRTFTQFCINKNTIAADYMPFCFTAYNMCSFISLIQILSSSIYLHLVANRKYSKKKTTTKRSAVTSESAVTELYLDFWVLVVVICKATCCELSITIIRGGKENSLAKLSPDNQKYGTENNE